MAKFKKGQKAKVLFIDSDDIEKGIQVGDIVTVDENGTTAPYVILSNGKRYPMRERRMEHYTETPETLTINGVEYIRKPEPAHEWKFGDVAVHEEYGVGIVTDVEDRLEFTCENGSRLTYCGRSDLIFLRRTDFSV